MSKYSPMPPGKPGIPARWTSSAKSGIGKALNPLSQVSFTTSHGIVNEVYFPREDNACTRDMELIVTNGKDFFSEEKRDTKHVTEMMGDGIPGYIITNECVQKKYKIVKEIITDPLRNTLLQKIEFLPAGRAKKEYHLYVLLAPHLSNSGGGNTAWVGDYKGIPMIFAERNGLVLALACSQNWLKRSVGYVGVSDGYLDLSQHKQITHEYQRAEDGNVAMIGEIDVAGANNSLVLAVGFGHDAVEAGHYAWASITDGFSYAKKRYISEWTEWQNALMQKEVTQDNFGKLSRISAAVLRMHESKSFIGGTIASMSIPWGFSKGDDDIGGYHLVWPRDLVQIAGGFLSMHSNDDAFRVINYLMVTQEEDGHWPQNMWLSGKANMRGIQIDQVALPILLINLCSTNGALDAHMIQTYWKVVKKGVAFIIKNGPATNQDRWEEENGISIFTLATEISALLAAAEFAEKNNEPDVAAYCRETADYWNANIEHWTYVTNTQLAKEAGVEGYYIRINPTGIAANDLDGKTIQLKNHADANSTMPINELISIDALALVRFGLRAADDPRILNTIKVIDAKLKVETPFGPCWHRYNNDGYGEHEDGSPYDGTGIGRAWPLLTGERAHYEIAAGNYKKAAALLKTMEAFANHGLFPEQVWDTKDLPELNLFFGKHTGSALPLVWAHAEYIKLCYSLRHKKVFDLPLHTQERYIKNRPKVDWEVWRFERPCVSLPKDKYLRIEVLSPAVVRWSNDNWTTYKEIKTHDTTVGIHFVNLPVESFSQGEILFTFYWVNSQRWENKDFKVTSGND
ncbi:MAG: glycoside hydrolase family 15 protein [Chitinophagaceae bacterium]